MDLGIRDFPGYLDNQNKVQHKYTPTPTPPLGTGECSHGASLHSLIDTSQGGGQFILSRSGYNTESLYTGSERATHSLHIKGLFCRFRK